MFKNRVELLNNYFFKKRVINATPPVIGIEVTNRCNIDCIMCPRQEMKRSIGDMDLTLFKKIINDINGKIEFVWLQNYGEPFLHKDIFEMIKYTKESNLKVGISTNATVLDRDSINNILESKLDYIIFAFDGAIESTYEKIRRGARYGEVIKNIKLFLDEKNRSNAKIFTVVQCIYMDETAKEINDFLNIWKKKGVNRIRIRQLTYGGEGKYKNLFRKQPCYWLWHNPQVTWDGVFIPCCQDVNAIYPLGNVNSESVCTLWTSEKMNRLRQLHIEKKFVEIPLCRNCNMYQPNNILILGSTFFNMSIVNKLVPIVESYLTRMRY